MREDRERKYDATYHLGNTVVHVIAPPPMTEEQKQAIIADWHHAAWEAWNLLPVEERLRINAEYEEK